MKTSLYKVGDRVLLTGKDEIFIIHAIYRIELTWYYELNKFHDFLVNERALTLAND